MKDKLAIGLLTRVSFSKFDPTKTNKLMVAEYSNNHQTDGAMHSAHTRLIHRKYVDPIQKLETKIRQWVETMTLPWEDRGNRLLPAANVQAFQETLAKHRIHWDHAIDDFVGEWDEVVADARQRLNGDFRPSAYPSADEVRGRFRMLTTFMPLPDNHRLVADIRDQMEEVFAERLADASVDLRRRLVDKLHHLATRCEASASGEKTKFYETNVSNILDLCDMLPRMFIGDDPDLEQAIRDARKMLDGIDADAIKASSIIAHDIKAKARAIASSLL
jgi:hypothetical protein